MNLLKILIATLIAFGSLFGTSYARDQIKIVGQLSLFGLLHMRCQIKNQRQLMLQSKFLINSFTSPLLSKFLIHQKLLDGSYKCIKRMLQNYYTVGFITD